MCAAPGSKTTQLIEMIHSDEESAFPGINKILSIYKQIMQILLIFICLQRDL